MAFFTELAMNATTLATSQNGIALTTVGRYLHGFFVNATEAEGTDLTLDLEIWAHDPTGTYVPVVPQSDVDTNEWFTTITGGSFQKYVQFGDVNSTAVHANADPLLIPWSEGGRWRVVAVPTSGTSSDTLVLVALLSDGIL